jgi:uncharacterized protein (DUF1501 family)
MMNRRDFLRTAVVPLAGGCSLLRAADADAQAGGYRALVCLFLFGGNDGINSMPPVDTDGYGRYSSVRRSLAVPRADIVQLDANYGLHPGLAPLKPIWDESRMALMFNVGPLSRPMTLSQYQEWRARNDHTLVPDKLFSHSDQQILWENAGTETVQLRGGWGGRLMEAAGGGQQAISFGGNSRFGAGRALQELTLPGPGSKLELEGYWEGTQTNARRAALNALLAENGTQLLHQHYARSQRDAIAKGTALGAILSQAPLNGQPDAANPELSAAFGHLSGPQAGPLCQQLYQVAKFIKHRNTVGGSRHLYFVSLGGFDHHGDQLRQQAALLAQLGTGVAAFWNALKSIGAHDMATLFTESDFGRTFKPNASGGTDHAWGNQHFVVGGAVNGGRSFGRYPSLVVGGPDDAAVSQWEQQGRWIPAISVAQYAGKLIDWFSPGMADKSSILPTLSAFAGDTQDLNFLRL